MLRLIFNLTKKRIQRNSCKFLYSLHYIFTYILPEWPSFSNVIGSGSGLWNPIISKAGKDSGIDLEDDNAIGDCNFPAHNLKCCAHMCWSKEFKTNNYIIMLESHFYININIIMNLNLPRFL